MLKSTAQKLLALNYDLYESQASEWDKTRTQIWEQPIIDFISHIRPNSSVLDLGCGNARLYQKLADLPIDYLGIDPSVNFIKLNQQKYPATNFSVGDGLNLKDINKFDYIISIAVLHHIPSQELQLKFLHNIYAALKLGGEVLITVWNRHQTRYQKYLNNPKPYSDMDQTDTIVPWRQSGKSRYVRAFTTTELANLAQTTGFKNIKVEYINKLGKSDIENGLNILLTAKK